MRTLPRGTLDKWLAFDSVEPIGEQRAQHAELTALLSRLTAITMAINGQDMQPLEIDGYMPARYRPETKPKKKPKPAESFAQVAAFLGLQQTVKEHGRDNQSS